MGLQSPTPGRWPWAAYCKVLISLSTPSLLRWAAAGATTKPRPVRCWHCCNGRRAWAWIVSSCGLIATSWCGLPAMKTAWKLGGWRRCLQRSDERCRRLKCWNYAGCPSIAISVQTSCHGWRWGWGRVSQRRPGSGGGSLERSIRIKKRLSNMSSRALKVLQEKKQVLRSARRRRSALCLRGCSHCLGASALPQSWARVRPPLA